MSDTTKRIEPKDVVAAFRATGLIPARSTYRTELTACGLGCLMAQRGIDMRKVDDEDSMSACALGLSREYHIGFVRGWDGRKITYNDAATTEDRVAGFMDGQMAWAAVREVLA